MIIMHIKAQAAALVVKAVQVEAVWGVLLGYGEYYDNLCEERRLAYEARKSFEGFHADESPEDDDEEDCEDDYEEPLVERDFEG